MGNWSIVLGERPMRAGRLSDFFLGDNISHSFIRIEDDQHRPFLELHGLYDWGLGAIFNTIANALTGHPHHFAHTHVLALTGDRLMHIFAAHCPVTETVELAAPKDVILRDAECMIRAADIINRHRPDYYFDYFHMEQGGICCHTVSKELLRTIHIDITKQQLPFNTPGRQTNLEKIDPALKAVTVNTTTSLADLEREMVVEIAGLSPDWKTSFYRLTPDCPHPAGAMIAPGTPPKALTAA